MGSIGIAVLCWLHKKSADTQPCDCNPESVIPYKLKAFLFVLLVNLIMVTLSFSLVISWSQIDYRHSRHHTVSRQEERVAVQVQGKSPTLNLSLFISPPKNIYLRIPNREKSRSQCQGQNKLERMTVSFEVEVFLMGSSYA